MATTAQLPTQVSPPQFALSPALPHQVGGAEVWAFPVLPGVDGPLLGPGADEASEALGIDLLAALEAMQRGLEPEVPLQVARHACRVPSDDPDEPVLGSVRSVATPNSRWRRTSGTASPRTSTTSPRPAIVCTSWRRGRTDSTMAVIGRTN